MDGLNAPKWTDAYGMDRNPPNDRTHPSDQMGKVHEDVADADLLDPRPLVRYGVNIRIWIIGTISGSLRCIPIYGDRRSVYVPKTNATTQKCT